MKKAMILLSMVGMILFSGCLGQTTKKKFDYEPYNADMVEYSEAYNLVFNYVREDLVQYVKDTFPAYPMLIGVICEVKPKVHTDSMYIMMKGKITRAWQIYEKDVVPASSEKVAILNEGDQTDEVLAAPKAFMVFKLEKGKGKVYLRYTMKRLRTYEFVLNVEQGLTGWSVTKDKSVR